MDYGAILDELRKADEPIYVAASMAQHDETAKLIFDLLIQTQTAAVKYLISARHVQKQTQWIRDVSTETP